MDDKDINIFDPNEALVLKKEINLSLNIENSKNNEILKIKDLIKASVIYRIR